MKIIALLRQSVSQPVTPSIPACIVPDSALVLPGRPVFVPDLGEGWQGQPVIALRVGRLGRDIAPAFASRYVNAVTVALWLRLADIPADLSAGLLCGMDSSLAPGAWIPVADLGDAPVHVTTPAADIEVDIEAEIISAVAAVSRYMTLKMGDIILASGAGGAVDLVAGTRVTASIDSREVLSVKIL
ncbi:MAG: fumarylacetoacetate hydrolase family protein [Duncaniella sp.]|nr:fumarylacetoacetate hydrolase family protein [Duncaniella sp.]MDE6582359.1 fumarylacetoacetate hydrolase family protein [Duncaniella sp.]